MLAPRTITVVTLTLAWAGVTATAPVMAPLGKAFVRVHAHGPTAAGQQLEPPPTASREPAPTSDLGAVVGWFCPMHPVHTSHEAGRCPICGMALVAGNPYDTSDYPLEVVTRPSAVVAGKPVTMTFTVRHPRTGELVKTYEVVHDKRYHLFVISQDMSVFEHLHPELQANGSWQIQLTLPRPGYYRILSDFLPSGGAPQFLSRTIVTNGFDEDLVSQTARLQPDTVLTKTVDSITASLEFDPAVLVAGQYGHLRYTLTDATTGAPVTDLQPYLGAFGHTLILSEDMADYVHSHPTEGVEHDISRGLGGPRVTFEGYMPQPGRYRAWTQFLRNDRLTTISFTVNVVSLEEAFRSR